LPLVVRASTAPPTSSSRSRAVQAPQWPLICRASGHPYHATFNPPRVAGVCDEDGSALYQRPDDRADVVRARLETQLPPFIQVVDHYRKQGVLRPVDGAQSIDAVTESLLRSVAAGQPA
jgi:adenylate kinase